MFIVCTLTYFITISDNYQIEPYRGERTKNHLNIFLCNQKCNLKTVNVEFLLDSYLCIDRNSFYLYT